MLDLELTEEQENIQDRARRFVEDEVKPVIDELDREKRYDVDLLKGMGQEGLLGVCFPEKYNGAGLDYLSLGLVCEEIERGDTSLRELISVHTALHGLGLLQWGTEQQKQHYLSRLATGEILGCFGLTEPEAGSDVASMTSRARKDGDEYVLNGEKRWIGWVDVVDVGLVFAKTDPEAGSDGVSAFVVEFDSPGLETGAIQGKLGVHAANTGWIKMDDVRVPERNLVGKEGEGFKVAMSCLDNGRFTVAAGCLGLMRACREASVEYAKKREAFGRPIGQFQLVQQKIARMTRDLEAGRGLVRQAAWLKNQGRRNTRETALAKWFCTERAFEAADEAVQLHGANGFCRDYPVERYLRNAKGAEIYEGTNEIQQVLQAQYALGMREDKPLRKELPAWPFQEEA